MADDWTQVGTWWCDLRPTVEDAIKRAKEMISNPAPNVRGHSPREVEIRPKANGEEVWEVRVFFKAA